MHLRRDIDKEEQNLINDTMHKIIMNADIFERFYQDIVTFLIDY